MQHMDQPDARTDMTPEPFTAASDSAMQATEHAVGPDEAVDPVCGMRVKKASAQYTANYQGESQPWQTFYFCSDECKQLFERDPEKYVSIP